MQLPELLVPAHISQKNPLQATKLWLHGTDGKPSVQLLENSHPTWRKGDDGLKKRVSEFRTVVSLVETLALKQHKGRGLVPPKQLFLAAGALDKKVLQEHSMTLDMTRAWLGKKAHDTQGGAQEVGACIAPLPPAAVYRLLAPHLAPCCPAPCLHDCIDISPPCRPSSMLCSITRAWQHPRRRSERLQVLIREVALHFAAPNPCNLAASYTIMPLLKLAGMPVAKDARRLQASLVSRLDALGEGGGHIQAGVLELGVPDVVLGLGGAAGPLLVMCMVLPHV